MRRLIECSNVMPPSMLGGDIKPVCQSAQAFSFSVWYEKPCHSVVAYDLKMRAWHAQTRQHPLPERSAYFCVCAHVDALAYGFDASGRGAFR